MPEAGVGAVARSIVWLCPGLADETRPIFLQSKAELLDAVGSIIHDPELRERFQVELEKLKSGYVPRRPKHDNVVPLFAGRVSSHRASSICRLRSLC
jgi:hypothetical protein